MANYNQHSCYCMYIQLSIELLEMSHHKAVVTRNKPDVQTLLPWRKQSTRNSLSIFTWKSFCYRNASFHVQKLFHCLPHFPSQDQRNLILVVPVVTTNKLTLWGGACYDFPCAIRSLDLTRLASWNNFPAKSRRWIGHRANPTLQTSSKVL